MCRDQDRLALIILAGGTSMRLGMTIAQVVTAYIASDVALVLDPSLLDFKSVLKDVEEAGSSAGRQMLVLKATNEHEINEAFASIVQAKAGAILVGAGPIFLGKRREIIALANRHKLPASYVTRQYPEAGSLMSYGPSKTDAYRRAGLYVGKILNGARPADLPVELPTKFELVINIKAAKTLGIDVPAQLLARADVVIE